MQSTYEPPFKKAARSEKSPSSKTRASKFKCPCCTQSEIKKLIDYPFGQKQIAAQAIMNCQCGFLFTAPHPTQEELNQYYTHTFNSSWVFRADYKHYSQRTIGQYIFLSRLFHENPSRKWEVLDVGAGPGIAASTFKRLNSNIRMTALELDKESETYLREKNIQHMKESVTTPGLEDRVSERFDLIVMSHVLEHFSLYSLPAVIQNLSRLLTPSGYLFIEVPYCPVDKDFFKIDQSPHLLFFNDKSVLELVKRHTSLGLVAQERSGTDIPDQNFAFTPEKVSIKRKIYTLSRDLISPNLRALVKQNLLGIQPAKEVFDPSFYFSNSKGDVLRMLYQQPNKVR